ncbi:MAG: cytochrome d ubiquinol oxidase subunit II [Gaiellaceae bacterium]
MLHLYLIPLVFALIGLTFYAVLGGADFGAGFWQLSAGKGRQANAVREHAHAAMAPVWEANHVWLILVLTVVWTAYPTAFESIASTLSIPLFIAAVGIVFRGVTYALRAGAAGPREVGAIDTVFAISSVLTPFALGTAIGGIASGRVPVGNATGSQFSSWLNPTSILIGALAVATAAYLAAVFLSADAAKLGDHELEGRFRRRALGAGVVAGGIALAGLGVIAGDADRIYHRLTSGYGLAALILSVVAGAATLVLVWHRRYEPARYGAAVAVAAIIAGWALAQSPLFVSGLTIRAAAAPRTTLIAVIVVVIGGAVILFPSLALLFRLFLRGRLVDSGDGFDLWPRTRVAGASRHPLFARAALACLIAGVGLLTVAETAWAHALGVVSLLGFVALGFPAALPPETGAPGNSKEDWPDNSRQRS